ncbi:hypothetical protein ROZALSC1DRAFT_30007 [Rozella allomycis CSF55]|uniref:CUE domain-containing protein n=1 Tax=Rozella allomycis (strain CSF55) TaxID=988480 RepID=A0A075AZV1_ROZAC|nr:hypothetical protein O9G_003287 [Rozella allomycis CSF55]RKP18278.1 hypothetical protein ROZALSC1DRAFT_30007 [Rozella allomycis CSF55]|eukprot:EPZ35803.1 hypothetical protein O9G_003287 [Rozella allomycis CSF55]
MSDTDNVDSLHCIFPQLDKEIISSVFSSNQGDFERTLNVLLEMSDDSPPDERARAAQIREDELFARSLQDETFVNELQMDGEFRRSVSENGEAEVKSESDWVAKLSGMGEATKKKVKQMYIKYISAKDPMERNRLLSKTENDYE